MVRGTGNVCFHINWSSFPENMKAIRVNTMMGTAVITILVLSSFRCSTSGSSSSPGTEFIALNDSLSFIKMVKGKVL